MTADLAKLRDSILDRARRDNPDQPLRWRQITTDTYCPTGVALECTAPRTGETHVIADYPGGPQADEEGVYDCCPTLQFETFSEVVAEYLVALLNRDAEAVAEGLPESDVAALDAVAEAEFAQDTEGQR